jgi:hypothetical protein
MHCPTSSSGRGRLMSSLEALLSVPVVHGALIAVREVGRVVHSRVSD